MKTFYITFCLCISIIIYSCDGGKYSSDPPIFSFVFPSNLPIRIVSFKNGQILDSINSINMYKYSPKDFNYIYTFTNQDTTIHSKYHAILNNFESVNFKEHAGDYFSNYYDSTIIYFDSTKIKKYFHNPNNFKSVYFSEADCFNDNRLRCVNNFFIDTIYSRRIYLPRYLYIFSKIDYQLADTLIKK